MSKEAMKLALEALGQCRYRSLLVDKIVDPAVTALREALAEQPAQQVVDCHATGVCVQSGLRAEQPAQRKPLTDEWIRSRCGQTWVFETAKQWIRLAEAAHDIKENT